MTPEEKMKENAAKAMGKAGMFGRLGKAANRMFGGGFAGGPRQQPYRSNITANRPMQGDQQASPFAEREKGLAATFAAARGRLKGQAREAQTETERGLERLQSRVGAVGGAVEKARGQALKEIQESAGEAETQLAAGEQAAKGELEAAKTQYDQFKETMQFQKDSFADQMALQWAEFDETQKAQMINAITALKNAGMTKASDFAKVFGEGGGVLTDIFGPGRAPQVRGSRIVTGNFSPQDIGRSEFY